MATLPRQGEVSPALVFRAEQDRPKGFIREIVALLTQPGRFFTRLHTAKATQYTFWIALLVLGVFVVNALHVPAANSAQPDMGGVPFDGGFPPVADPSMGGPPFDGAPLDGAPIEGGSFEGGGIPGSGSDSITDRWMTALTVVSIQLAQWFVLALLLSEVTMFNGHKPRLSMNLKIAIWASIPLALMTLLQLVFISGGGSIENTGFAGFLDEWPPFGEMSIHVQSVVHAFASLFTLFWAWSLILLYVGATVALRGKRFASVLIVLLWVVILTVAHSFQSYETLAEQAAITMEPAFEQIMPEGEMFPSDEMRPEGEVPPDREIFPEDEAPPMNRDEQLEPEIENF